MATVTKAGRYEIISELGRGAMGVVFKATDPVIGRAVAVKTIRLSEEGTGLSRPELLARFQTEARAAGLLTHPNIVVIYDAGEEDGLYYIIMELVEGKSLQAMIDAGQAFPLSRILRIMEQTCSALQFAHERNVVHRDIKPANLMLTGDDTVKVTDFGTAKILQIGTVQQTAHVMGTPSYMSPEQVKGRVVDGRSDIFSLGVMLYEMMTGEKPFPGQNITTVIYKIVNEEPVPPRQINPSIHPGISAIVMRALEKEPDRRYQSCREMLEDLKNYRSISSTGGNPQSTMVMGGAQSPAATVVMGGNGGRTVPNFDAMDAATAHSAASLTSRAAGPGQTPAIRRTGIITPVPEPKKKNIFATVLAAIFLLGVIVYGVNKLRPVLEDARELRSEQTKPQSSATSLPDAQTSTTPADGNSPEAATTPASTPTTSSVPLTELKHSEIPEEKAAPKKSVEPGLSPAAAEYKSHIEAVMAERGLEGRAKVVASGNALTLAGKLRPSEHGALLKFLRDAPPDVRLIDHIEYDDTPVSEAANNEEGGHPIPAKGRGAIHIVTDVIGATAVLHGPLGHVLNRCQTPCSFNDLIPTRYSLDVQKDGYKQISTALQVKANDVQDQKLSLESLAKGLFIASQPSGADVFINGAKQSGQTPVTLPLAPNTYNLVLRLPGYEAYASSVQVKDNLQTQLSIDLQEKSTTHVAWVQVNSNPKGAEILVDGNPTGQLTPARVQIPSGIRTITIKASGYQLLKRVVQLSDGGTSTIDDALKPSK